MTYDTKCFELARYFLLDARLSTPERDKELAKRIQGTIEDYLDEFADPPKYRARG
ncbi:MAG: hypothetical protein ACRD3M_18700 [Thermoanaerobaculia bacterium]